MKKILILICLMLYSNIANASFHGIEQADGSWKVKGDCNDRYKGGVYYICCNDTNNNEICKTEKEWSTYLKRRFGEISYMNDMANIPDFDRHSTRDATINMTKEDGFWNNLRKFFKGEAGF